MAKIIMMVNKGDFFYADGTILILQKYNLEICAEKKTLKTNEHIFFKYISCV